MLAAPLYAIGQGEGIIKVVGEVGSGKAMLCRKLVAQLPASVDSVYLGNPTLTPDDMLAAILADLGVDAPKPSQQARLTQLNAALLARHEADRRVVVFVEEAQVIALDNLETATDKLLQIVLFGQPELDVQLADQRIRQLKVRIPLNLSPLTKAEPGRAGGKSTHTMTTQRGFSLLELAIVLVIVTVLIGGLAVPLLAQIQARRIAKTNKTLAEARGETACAMLHMLI